MLLKPVSSAELLLARMEIKDPEVPRFHIEAENRWVDNPHHPDYIEGMERASRRRGDAVFEELLRRGCEFSLPTNTGWLRSLRRYSGSDETLIRLDTGREDDLKLLYLLSSAIGGHEDVEKIVMGCCLIESRVHAFMRAAGLMRSGVYIDEAGLRHSVDTGIGSTSITIGGQTLVPVTDEYAAATAAYVNWHTWRSMKYSIQFMEETIAHYRIRRLVELHASDAQQAESLRKAKSKS